MKKILLLFILYTNSSAYSQVNLNLGLMAYYPFSGNANDISGNNNNPVFNNATLTTDRLGNPNSAYHFNGADSYIQIPNSNTINTGNAISLCAWVRPMGYYAGTCHGNSVMMKGDGDFLTGNYFLRFDDASYSNNSNCSNTVDITHQNFYGINVITPVPGYTPYIQTNQWYSVIVTCDGTTAKLYINCVLIYSTPQTTTTFTNTYDLFLGKLNSGSYPYWLNGDLDEVRIYNRAINQAEVNVLGGCASAVGISGIINDYTPVLALNPCNNKITVEDATHFNIGDTVLMIQMKGAVIDTTNTAAFGTILDYKNAGNYEFNYIKSKAGNIIELKNKLTRQYDIPNGKVQLIRVPYYNSVTVNATLTCLPWDGSKGGVLVLNARDTVNLQADIDVSGNGFRGGAGFNSNTSFLTCFLNDYFYPVTHQFSGIKGESISTISDNIIRGKGNLAGGGGGGQGHNSGGGGGGNGGAGGFGGYQLDVCGSAPFDNRGIGGILLMNNTATNKIYLGSGGGAGQADNAGNIPPGGGNGGGLAIILGNYLKSNSNKIIANGNDAVVCTEVPGTSDCHDGMGGGGAGGTVLLAVSNYIDNAIANKIGGKGANVSSTVASAGQIGPGGGGGGGVLFINQPALPASVTSSNTGGPNGLLALAGYTPWGSTPGNNGLNVFNLVIPIDNTAFKTNIDSVRVKDSSTTCLAFDFHGFGFTNTNPIASWDWHFGDGGTANTQNTAHTYATAGTYTVQLIVTDINGCKDSITKDVVSNTMTVDAGSDSSFCGGPVSVQLHGTGTGNFAWTPAVYLNNSSIQNPTATINTTTTFYLNVTNIAGCTGNDSVTIHIDAVPVVRTLNDTSICRGSTLILSTTTGLGTYHWSPGIYVSDSTIANPLFTDTTTRTLIVTGSNGACSASDTITVTVKPLPVVSAGADTTICSTQTVTLSATGAFSYTWSPAIFLSDPNSANPVFSGNSSTTYFLTGTGANGCQGKDTVSINVNNPNSLVQPPDKSFCLKDTVHLDGNNGNNVQYLWAPPTYLSSTAIIDPVADPPASTSYTVTITDHACNYDSIFTVLVTVRPLPIVKASRANDIDCAVKSSQLTATGAIQYMWQPPGTLNNSSVSNPIATPTDNTLYVVTGTDNKGCKNKDSVTVLVKDGLNGYAIPNSFTPNGDGLNDCFGIKHWGAAQNVIFIIYNRWGEKVFETTNVNICWDGTYKGAQADVGTYIYYISANTACGPLVRKGSVLLIR